MNKYGSAHRVSHENNKYPDAGLGMECQLQEVGEYESLGATDAAPPALILTRAALGTRLEICTLNCQRNGHKPTMEALFFNNVDHTSMSDICEVPL